MSFYTGVAMDMRCMEHVPEEPEKLPFRLWGHYMCEGTQCGPTTGTLGRLTDSQCSYVFVGGGQPPAYNDDPLHMAKNVLRGSVLTPLPYVAFRVRF